LVLVLRPGKIGVSELVSSNSENISCVAFHPITVPQPGNAPLVIKAQIGMYDVDRVFMDAGSGINLIYAKTLRAMYISLEFLKPTDSSFHEIVPGSTNYPLG
jgi:hypothetical protein